MSYYYHKSSERRRLLLIFAFFAATSVIQAEPCQNPDQIENGKYQLYHETDPDDVWIAHYTCESGYKLRGDDEIYCVTETNEWQGTPPRCEKIDQTRVSGGGGRRKGNRGQDIEDEPNVTEEFASALDMSCLSDGLVRAPQIPNAEVVRYVRRKKGPYTFLVSFYECDDGYELENTNTDRLFCSQEQWVGDVPFCFSIDGEEAAGSEYEEGDEEEGTEEDDEQGYDERLVKHDCDEEQNQCDHECAAYHLPEESEPRIVCSCFTGYKLDEEDGTTCHDINECETNNGGCEQLCTNQPGSHKCTCREGLQPDPENDKRCIGVSNATEVKTEIKETHETTTTTEVNSVDLSENEIDNEIEGYMPKVPETAHETDEKEEHEEEEEEEEHQTVSYRVHEMEESEEKPHETHHESEKEEENNEIYESEDEKEDHEETHVTHETHHETHEPEEEDEEVEKVHETHPEVHHHHHETDSDVEEEHNKPETDGYEPDNEGESEDENEEDNEIDSTFHHTTPRVHFTTTARVQTTTQHILETVTHRHRHEDHDEDSTSDIEDVVYKEYEEETGEGEESDTEDNEIPVRGHHEREEERHRHHEVTEEEHENEENEIESETSKIICDDGLKLDDFGKCVDVNECLERDHGCQYCQNVYQGYECYCPEGYELAEDEKTCVDIDECTVYSDYNDNEDEDRSENAVTKVCSHECLNTLGSYRCLCRENFHLHHDQRTCVRDFCEDLNGHNKTRCSHGCEDEENGYRCTCPDDLILGPDEKTCREIVECNEGHKALCSPGVCSQTMDGGYKCKCGVGFKESHGRCVEVDECREGNHGCSHTCKNSYGSFQCLCPDGFELDADQKTCVDINECHEKGDTICEGFPCRNLEGSYICECPDGSEKQSCSVTCEHGFTLDTDGKRCVDVNNCLVNNGDCEQNCVNTDGGYYCLCNNGYRLNKDGRTCDDVNECELNNGNCSHDCINTRGGYSCSCPDELSLVDDEHTCALVNLCELNNGGCSHTCASVNGKVHCLCPKGYFVDPDDAKTCRDKDECADGKNAGCSHICENTIGSYECSCPNTLELASNKHTCIDYDECTENNAGCSNICINLIGSYHCACEAGYALGKDNHTCYDIDECAENTHDCSHNCVNRPGSYDCECPSGMEFRLNQFNCHDINECEVLGVNGGCSDTCVNTVGSYHCECPEGHFLDTDGKTCIDIDECAPENKRCSHECTNTHGHFTCSCPTGLVLGDDGLTCHDIDECAVDGNNGGCEHVCENFDGSYRCKCHKGYQLMEDNRSCEDINECETEGICEHTCINTLGGYYCQCNDGHQLRNDNRTCENLDPCLYRNGGCDQICKNILGKAVCSCNKGFSVNEDNPMACDDVDECAENEGLCQQKCINTIGGYKCECLQGYRPNEQGQCIDIDECRHFNGGCSSNAKCVNTGGSFACQCNPGYKLGNDKKTCYKISNKCVPLKDPKHGKMHCSRSRHRTQLFYKTKCSAWCDKGFTLMGTAVRHCNGTAGLWDGKEATCVPQSCPRLSPPQHGTIAPPLCLTGTILPGERCVLHCAPGFKPLGRRTAVCEFNQTWVPSEDLRCVAIAPTLEATPPPLKPVIRCPADVNVLLEPEQESVIVKLEKPQTNVDWWQFVDSHPAWAKQLQADLPAGVYPVIFRARSPNSVLSEECRFVVTVKAQIPPKVLFCPESFEVRLEQSEVARALHWEEPKFESAHHLKEVYKSHIPGDKFQIGIHEVEYIAVDRDGLKAECKFKVVVKGQRRLIPRPKPILPEPTHPQVDVERFLLCPNKPPTKLAASDFPFLEALPEGCRIESIKEQRRVPVVATSRQHHPRFGHVSPVSVLHKRPLEQLRQERPLNRHEQLMQHHQKLRPRFHGGLAETETLHHRPMHHVGGIRPNYNGLRYYSSWDNQQVPPPQSTYGGNHYASDPFNTQPASASSFFTSPHHNPIGHHDSHHFQRPFGNRW